MVLSKGQVKGEERTHCGGTNGWSTGAVATGAYQSRLHIPPPAPHPPVEPVQPRAEGSLLISVLTPRVRSVSVNKERKSELFQCWAARHREEQIATCTLAR